MSKTFKMRQLEGQHLLQVASRLGMTDEFANEVSLNSAERAMVQQDIVTLYREMKSASPRMKNEREAILFGPADLWKEEIKGDHKSYSMEEPEREVSIELSGEAVSGMYWALLSMLHPKQLLNIAPKSLNDIVWPLVDRVGLRNQIMKDLGIEKAKRRAIEFDDAPAPVGEPEVLCD